MFLIKGYNITDKDYTILQMIRFSAFSNVIIHSKNDLEEYRKALGHKVDNKIVFLSYNIPGQSKDAMILRYYLRGKNNAEIGKMLEMREDDVERIIETYIHGSKI